MLRLELNLETLWRFLSLIGVLLAIYLMRDIFWLLFITLIFTSALNPLVNVMHKKGWSRSLVTGLILLAFFSLLTLFGLILYPTLAAQLDRIIKTIPLVFSQNFYEQYGLNQILTYERFTQIYQEIVNASSNWLRTASFSLVQIGIGVVGGLISIITVIVITFYTLLDHDKIVSYLTDLMPEKHRYHAKSLILKTEEKLGTWLRGQLLVMLIMSVLTYLGLVSLGVQSALAIALIAGLMELIPFVGPTLTAFPALLVASSQSYYHMIGVVLLFFILQQIEGNLVVAKIMNRTVGLHPIIIILAVTIGATQGGPSGALLAIPFTAVCNIFFQEWRLKSLSNRS